MSEKILVDARGLSCPQPVLLTRKAIKPLSGGTVEVLVDTSASRDNVSRLGEKEGWTVRAEAQPDGGFKVVLSK